jgi:DNA-binding transcriptional ArsR family regulator
MKNIAEFEECAERLKALADPERLRIIMCLFGGEKNVGQIASALGDEIVNVSHHLGVLRNARVVAAERSGRFVKYRLHPDVLVTKKKGSQARYIEFGCCRVELAPDDD